MGETGGELGRIPIYEDGDQLRAAYRCLRAAELAVLI
jgi:hypothetical protein